MLGYRVYFNGEKFIADDFPAEMKRLSGDSTTSYFDTKLIAEAAVEEYNAYDLNDVKKCKECGKYFWQTDAEREWFFARNMKAPCRCYSCRKNRWNRKGGGDK